MKYSKENFLILTTLLCLIIAIIYFVRSFFYLNNSSEGFFIDLSSAFGTISLSLLFLFLFLKQSKSISKLKFIKLFYTFLISYAIAHLTYLLVVNGISNGATLFWQLTVYAFAIISLIMSINIKNDTTSVMN